MEELLTRPIMIILAGPNGAGKTTLYETIIKPKLNIPFVNADLIQKSEMSDQSVEAAYQAAKIAAQRRQGYLANRQSFISESTFSHPSKLQLIDDAKAAGFCVMLYHVNVCHADLSVARVASRVKNGGHNVPEHKIRARYKRNQKLIRQAVLKADAAFIYDNSRIKMLPLLAISFNHGRVNRVAESIPTWMCELYGKELFNHH